MQPEEQVGVIGDLVVICPGFEIKQLSMVPTSYVAVEEEGLPKVLRLLEALEDLDDVQHVWSNFDADDEALARVSENV